MLPVSKKKIFSPKQQKQHNFKFGLTGENHAKEFLLRRGFLVVAQNYLAPDSTEIDLVALQFSHQHKNIELNKQTLTQFISRHWQQLTLVFVEVKTRNTHSYGSPSYAVDRTKLNHMKRASFHFCLERGYPWQKMDYRFDIISIVAIKNKPPQIEHFENVTWLR